MKTLNSNHPATICFDVTQKTNYIDSNYRQTNESYRGKSFFRYLIFLSIMLIVLVLPIHAQNGTENDPFLIEDLSDFQAFRDGINSGIAFDYWNNTSITVPQHGLNAYFKLNGNIDLSSVCSQGSGISWTPIGTSSSPFSGNFDGNGKEISHCYIHTTTSVRQGLFGTISGAVIDGINLVATDITGGQYGGGLCGFSINSTISNCTNSGSVKKETSAESTGGICGCIEKSTIINCTNNSSVTGYGHNIGGICGGTKDTCFIIGCSNNGTVTVNTEGNYIGGICGVVENGSACWIEKCSNNGAVISSFSHVGGIIGRVIGNHLTIDSCFNSGSITGNVSVGGIGGNLVRSSVLYCVNRGDVTASSINCAGIIGRAFGTNTVSYCTNYGSVAGKAQLSGICGTCAGDNNTPGEGTISYCSNHGRLSALPNGGYSNVGGICGFLTKASGSIAYCTNSGDIVVTSTYTQIAAGGICGNIAAETGNFVYINNCINIGNIYGSQTKIGGICGTTSLASINYCTNSGIISGTNRVGGICGWISNAADTVCYCVNSGNVMGTAEFGGVIGDVESTQSVLLNCCYDKQMCIATNGIGSPAGSTNAVSKLTDEMTGTQLYDDDVNWSEETDLYPVPMGVDTTAAAYLAKLSIQLYGSQTVNQVDSNFTVSTASGVQWTDNAGHVSFNGANATILCEPGTKDTITATKNGIFKSIAINVNKTIPAIADISAPTAICSGETFSSSGLTEPTVTANGSTVQSKPWEISGDDFVTKTVFTDLEAFKATALGDSCNGWKLRMSAINGCGSGYGNSVALTIKPTYDMSPEIATVRKGTIYTENGWNINTADLVAGTYNYDRTESTAIGGCDSIVRLTLTVAPSYTVDSLGDLKALRTGVNAGSSFTYKGNVIPAGGSGTYFILTADIDMGSENWTGIGAGTGVGASNFQGIFYGGGHSISNLTILGASFAYQGLFGTISGATIDSVNLVDVNISAGYIIGGLCGYALPNSTISNCTISGQIQKGEWNTRTGGICGELQNSTIINCTNNAKIIGWGNMHGGICGAMSGSSTIINCTNNGTVTLHTDGQRIGGICGYILTNSDCRIVKCVNTGNLVSPFNYSGGIVGMMNTTNTSLTIDSCYNSGNISGNLCVGGIAGQLFHGMIRYCANDGDVTSAYNVSGICGSIDGAVDISYSSNHGTITANSQTESSVVGGICGYFESSASSSVAYCTNSGTIVGNSTNANTCAGGIGGYISPGGSNRFSITNCINIGNVYGSTAQVAGICGNSSKTTVAYCSNSGLISGSRNVGGICGILDDATDSLRYCMNNGNVISTSNSNFGGVVGQSSTTRILNCFYDKQMCPITNGIGQPPSSTNAVGKLTAEMIGLLFGDDTKWIQETGFYPVPLGVDTTGAAHLAKLPVSLSGSETINEVSSNFTVGTANDVQWTCKAGHVTLDGAQATVNCLAGTEDTLLATHNGLHKSIYFTVNKNIPTISNISEPASAICSGETFQNSGILTPTVEENGSAIQTRQWEISGDNFATKTIYTSLGNFKAAHLGDTCNGWKLRYCAINNCGAGYSNSVTLTIHSTYDLVFDTTVCNSYVWEGTTYTTSQTVVKNFTSSEGCDSVRTLNLTVNYNDTTEFTVTACDNYTWEGQMFTVGCDSTRTFENQYHCDSIVTMHLTINNSSAPSSFTETACDSYTWEGETYTESCDSTRTFENQYHCDSVVTMHLTINRSSTPSSFSETACNSYTWAGETYTESCDSTRTFTNQAQCDSVVTMHLTIHHSDTTEFSATACDSYTWEGETYTESCDSTRTFTDQYHCDSVVTMHLTINSSSAPSSFTETACDSYTWEGETYTESCDSTRTFENQYHCDSVVTMYLTINSSSTPSSFTEMACNSYTWAGETYTESCDSTRTFTNQAQCDSVVTMHLTIHHSDTTEFSATACDSYTWAGETYTESCDSTRTFTDQYQCDSVVTMHLTIHDSIQNMLPAVTACNSYTWEVDGLTYTSSQILRYEVPNGRVESGCDSIIYCNLTIDSDYDMPAVDTTVFLGAIYTENGWNINTADSAVGTYSYSRTEHTTIGGCDSTVHLNLTIEIITIDNLVELQQLRDSINSHQEFTFKNFTIPQGGGNVYFQLTSDIDLSSVCSEESGNSWVPIGGSSQSFKGVFDGNGHSITGMYIEATSNYVGFFGAIYGATIKNLSVDGSIVCKTGGISRIGGIVGYVYEYDNFSDVLLTGLISSVDISDTGAIALSHVGGIVGGTQNNKASMTTISKCIFTGSIELTSTTDCIGGIVGYISVNDSIGNCANFGNVSSKAYNAYVGGILGYENAIFKGIHNCFNVGNVTNGGGNYVGGICGNAKKICPMSNNYYDKQMCTALDGAGIGSKMSLAEAAKLTSEMTGSQLFNDGTDWNETDGMYPIPKGLENQITAVAAATPIFLNDEETVTCITNHFTVGTNNNVAWESTTGNILINGSNATIQNMGQDTLIASIGNTVYKRIAVVVTNQENEPLTIDNLNELLDFRTGINSGQVFTYKGNTVPPGGANTYFKLTTDIDLTSVCSGGNSWIPIGDSVHPFSGTFDGGGHSITYMYIAATENYMGFFGVINTTVKNLSVDGTIVCQTDGIIGIGGVVGYVFENKSKTLLSRLNSSVVISDAGSIALGHVGGIIGGVYGSLVFYQTTIEKCVFTDSIILTTASNCVGGIVGYASHGDKIIHSANLGKVHSGGTDAYVGGILGYINASEFKGIQNCYSVGAVSNGGTVHYGSIIGYNKTFDRDSIFNNYYYGTVDFGGMSMPDSCAYYKTLAEFASGEVCYGLNSDQCTLTWYQTLEADTLPVLDSTRLVVYYSNDQYFNYEPLADSICKGNTYQEYGWNINTADSTLGTHLYKRHLYTTVSGCDSIVWLKLTILGTSTGIDVQEQCDSLTWIDGITYTESTNLPTYTLVNSQGCDSVVTLHLTIIPSASYQFWFTACDSCVWFGNTYYESGDYFKTYEGGAANGCDSTITMHLTINNSVTHEFDVTACNSYTWDGTDYIASGDYVKKYIGGASNHCDSTVTLHLTINHSNEGDTTAVACGSFTWYGTTYDETPATAPTHVLQNAAGCDSTVTLHLTINNSNSGDTSATVCDSFTWYGTTYTETPVPSPTHTFQNVSGCDSVVTLDLTIIHSASSQFSFTTCDSCVWFGNTYYESGDYVKKYIGGASNHCDSTVTLHLTINHSNVGDTTAVACNSFTWYGTTYYATPATAPTHVLQNAAGCDSTVTLDLTINYSNTGDTSATVCDSFTWYGTTYTETPVPSPTRTFQNVAGCDSVVTFDLTINHSVLYDSSFSACDSCIWNGDTYYQSGIYSKTFDGGAANGCDSTVTLHLTINQSSASDTSATVCDSFTWYGTTYTETPATPPTHTFQNVSGCDSTVTLHLTINDVVATDTFVTACNNFTWYGITYYSTPTTPPTRTYQTTSGCDSVVTLRLTINRTVYGTDVQDHCDTYTWINGITYTQSTNNPRVILSSSSGCDSIVTLNLTIRRRTYGVDVQEHCDSYTWLDGHTYTSSTQTPTRTLTNSVGCDSIITLHLTINHSVTHDFDQAACERFTWHGTEYTQSGNYMETFEGVAAHGCDSIVTMHLTINHNNTGDTTVIACDSFTWYGTTYTETPETAPTYTLTNAAGCDSVVTLHLTIHHSSVGDSFVVACNSFTWYDTIFTETPQIAPTHILENAIGCDSIVTLHLTINHDNTGDTIADACYSFSWYGQTYTETPRIAPTHTFQNSSGCDSVVTLHLTIHQATYGIDEQDHCFSYTWIDGITYTESTNTPTWTLVNSAGCDSIVTLHLTIRQITYGTDVQEHCDSYTWIDGHTYAESTDTPTFTLTNAAGCDSIVTLNLTINNSNTGIDVQEHCDRYVWIDGFTYLRSTNTPTYTLTNAAGCDSVVTLHLTINNSSTGIDEQSHCYSYTWINGITYTESTNTPTDTLINAVGCDSIVTLHLTIIDSVTSEFYAAACDSYTWDGDNYTASGHYRKSYPAANGCDSIATLHLTIYNSVTYELYETACDQYVWNNTTYTESGNYTQLFETIHGCDSSVTLHLTIIVSPVAPTGTSTVNNNCSGTGDGTITVTSPLGNEFEYSIDGINYQTGTLFDDLVEGNYPLSVRIIGTTCSTTATIHVGTSIVRPNAMASNNGPLCIGETLYLSGEESDYGSYITYSWTGPNGFSSTLRDPNAITNVTMANAGVYVLTVTNWLTFCEKIVSTTVVINEPSSSIDVQEHCDSYTWMNGVTYTESTETPTWTLENSVGCDSVITLHLTINKSVTREWNTTACDSYTWDGDTYYESGNYQKTYIAANGCDSIETLRLTINNSTTSEFSETACDTYDWNGTIYNASGDYIQSFETAAHCDSIVTLHLTINYSPIEPTVDTTINTACPGHGNGTITVTAPLGDEYEYSIDAENFQASPYFDWLYEGNYPVTVRRIGTTCTSSTLVTIGTSFTRPIAVASNNGPLCIGDALMLSGEGSSENHIYLWSGPNGFTSDQKNPEVIANVTLENAGEYFLTVSNTFTLCDNTVSTIVEINEPNTGIDEQTHCDSYTWIDGITYTESTDTPTWTLENADGCDSIVTLHLTIKGSVYNQFSVSSCESYEWDNDTYTESGDYVKSFETYDGCDSIVTMHLTIKHNVTHEFSASACNSYSWDGDVYTSTGDFVKTYPAANGCDSIVTLHLTINGIASYDLYVRSCNEYTWNDSVYALSGNYVQIFETEEGCDSLVTLHLSIIVSPEDPTVETTINTACPGAGNGTITVTAPLGDIYEYSINGTDYQISPYFEGLYEGDYSVYVRFIGTTCPSSILVPIGASFTRPIAVASNNGPLCIGDALMLSGEGSSENQIYLWSGPNGFTSDQKNPEVIANVTLENAGEYFLTVSNTFTLCDNTVSTIVEINEPNTGIDEQTHCDSYTWIDGITYTESTDTPTWTLPNAAGCDSVVTLHLNIIHSITNEWSASSCNSFTWDGDTFTESGDYVKTYPASNGCDSIVTLHLRIFNDVTNDLFLTACDIYIWNGIPCTQSGTYTQTILTPQGCDSTVVLHLTIVSSPNAPTATTTINSACPGVGNGTITVTSPLGNEYEYSIDGVNYQASTLFEGLYEGDHTLTVRNNTTLCTAESMIHVDASIDRPDGMATNNGPLCVGETLILSGEGSSVGDNFTYTWSGPNGFTSDQMNPEALANVTLENAGTYYLTVVNLLTLCDNNLTTIVEINEPSTSIDEQTHCDSYQWMDSIIYTESTDTPTWTLTNMAGCDSVITLHLTINNSVTHEWSATACEEYTWNNIVYNASGDYEQVFETVNGCDSVVTLHLTINHHVEYNFSASACDSYTWDGDTYTESGAYEKVYNTIHFCDSIVTLYLTIYNSTTYEFSLAACDEYVWNGLTYNQSGTYTQNIITEHGCDSMVTLHLTIFNSPDAPTATTIINSACPGTGNGSITVTSPLGNEYEYSIDGVNYQASTLFEDLYEGDYTLTVRNIASLCTADSMIQIGTSIDRPAGMASNNGPLCVGETLILSGEGSSVGDNFSYTWSGPNGFTSDQMNPEAIANVTPDNAGVYYLTVVNLLTLCDNNLTTIVEVNEPNTGIDEQEACGSFTWIDGITYTESTDTPTWTLTNAAGCDSVVTLHLTVYSMPNVTISGNLLIHEGQSTTLSAHGAIYYEWSTGENTASITVAPLDTTLYWVIGTDAHGCVGTAEATVEVIPSCDTVYYAFNEVACNSYSWDGDIYLESGTYRKSYPAFNGCDSVVTLNLTINNSINAEPEEFSICYGSEMIWHDNVYYMEGIYHDTLQTISGCDSICTMILTFNPLARVFIGGNLVIVAGESTTLTAYGAVSYVWSTGDTTSSITVSPTVTSTYAVTGTDANGCVGMNYVIVTVTECPPVYSSFEDSACDSYEWGNLTITESGFYSQTFTSSIGCDSIVALLLTIYDSKTVDLYDAACESYTWNDVTYTESGNYVQEFETINGCDSIVTLHLTIHQNIAYEFSESSCGSYIWNNTTYTNSGIYVQYFESMNGCDSIVTLDLTILDNAVVSWNASACYSYTWNSRTYTESGAYVQTFQAFNGCDSIVTLHLTINNSVTDEWSASACDYFTWNGDTYDESGDYVQLLESIHGCDSIVTLHLTIYNSVYYEWSTSACTNFVWNNETYSQSGDYIQTFESKDGCDSVVMLHLTIYQCASYEWYASACNKFIWEYATFTESGSYSQQFETSHGCDSIVTLHLTIYKSATHEFSRMACDSYTWNDEVYTESGSYVQIFQTAAGCDSVVTMHLTINNNVTNEWSNVVCNSLIWNDYTYTQSGDYVQSFTTAQGCDSIVTLHLTVYHDVTSEFNKSICDSYTWNDVTYTESGDYVQSFETMLGCDSIVTMHLTVNYSISHEFSEVACDSYTWNNETYTESGDYVQRFHTNNICDSTVTLHLTINNSADVEFNVAACVSYTWNDVTYTESGDYVQMFETVHGCDSIVTLHLGIYQSTSSEFSVVACDSYDWNGLIYTETGDFVQVLQTAHGCDSVVTMHLTLNYSESFEFNAMACDYFVWNNETYTESGDYVQIFYTPSGCESVVTLHLVIHHSIDIELYETACDSYTLNDITYTESGDYLQEYITPSGCDSSYILHLTINNSFNNEFSVTTCIEYTWNDETYTESGDYVQTFKTIHDCDSIVTLHLTLQPLPVIEIEGDTVIQQGTSTTLTAHGALFYLWSTGDTTASITVTPEQTTTYYVFGMDEFGCIGEADVTVTVTLGIMEIDEAMFKVYPNPANTYLVVEGEEMISIEVYNSVGQRMIDRTMNRESSIRIETQSCEAGMYIIRIRTSNGAVINKRVIIAR